MRARGLKKRRETALREAGFSLLEFVISLGFMASLSGLIAGSSFLALKTNHETGARADVAVATATSTRWLVRDIHRADTTTIVDSAAAVSTATFAWVDGGPVACAYYVSGADLVRDCGGAAVSNAARFIGGLEFTRAGDLVTVVYTITPTNAPGASEQISLSVALGGG